MLGDASFDGRGYVVFMDSFFVMIRLFIALRARRIYAVGQSKAKRPEKKADKRSWPFQSYEKTELQFVPRRWCRVCSQFVDPRTLKASAVRSCSPLCLCMQALD